MKNKISRLMVSVFVLIICLSLVSGCSTSNNSNVQENDSPTSGDSASNADNSKKENPKLTYWVVLSTPYVTNYIELPFRQNLQKKTGIEVEYMHPSSGSYQETLNIVLASGEYPDMIEYSWPTYPGGVVKLYNDGVILELTELMEEHAPNLTNYYRQNPEIARQVKSDDGKFYLMPFIRGSKELRHTSGPVLRADWLKKAGLEPPKTIAEWETVLTAFKEQQNCKAPFTGTLDNIRSTFVTAFDVSSSFYPDNKKVKYGPVEAGFKEFLITMASWYQKGLIDPNFATVDKKIQDSNMTTGVGGSTYAAGGSQVGPYLQTAKAENPEYDLITTTFPTKNPNEKPKYRNSYEFTTNGHVVITTACKYPEVAMKFLDYGYGEEGHILYNFGIEGESFNYVDGVPTYTDLIMKNPEGKSVSVAMSMYTLANVCGPFVQDAGYIQQYYQLPQQKQALVDWSDCDENTSIMPPITFTPEESAEVAKIMNEINTYVDEMTIKFIMGREPVSEIDNFQASIKKMNIDRAIEIYQAALDRYYSR